MDHYFSSCQHNLDNFTVTCEYLASRGFKPDAPVGCSIVFRGSYQLSHPSFNQPVSAVVTLWKKPNETFSILIQCACRIYEEQVAAQLHREIVQSWEQATPELKPLP